MHSIILTEHSHITWYMALVDFFPVILFGIAAFFLLRDLWKKMPVWNYVVIVVGAVGVFLAGFEKCLYKTFRVAGLGDTMEWMNTIYFPFQSIAFMIFGAGLLICSLKLSKKSSTFTKVAAAAPLTMVCIVFQVLGALAVAVALILVSLKMKKKLGVAFFALAFVGWMAMGGLGSKFDDTSTMHWISQCTNILAEGFFFCGVLYLHLNGLEDPVMLGLAPAEPEEEVVEVKPTKAKKE